MNLARISLAKKVKRDIEYMTYSCKHSRRDNESLSFWQLRLAFSNADINETLRTITDDIEYTERLYSELDFVRSMQLLALRSKDRK